MIVAVIKPTCNENIYLSFSDAVKVQLFYK